ncbi:MAG: DNA-binding protein [Candidatus Omnitrophota bacterium]
MNKGYRASGIGYRVFVLALISCSLQFTDCYAGTVTSSDLIEKAKELDGKPVQYKGEVVTAILNRGEYSWVNLNDGRNAVGVWARTADIEPVRFIGGYKRKGDILEVDGVFNRACPAHNGEMDIHAKAVKVIEKGEIIKEHLNKKRSALSFILFSLVLLTAFVFRKRV